MRQTKSWLVIGIVAGLGIAVGLALWVLPGWWGPRDTEISGGSGPAAEKKIGLVYTAPHVIINQIVDGFKDGLAREAGGVKYRIVERHASGDTSQYSATVSTVLSEGLDVLVPITTPIAQPALKQAPAAVPVCFLGITDPVGAGLVDSLDHPGRSTGVSDLAPFGKTLELIRALLPAAKTVGYPYNPEDQAAVFGLQQVKRLGPTFGLTIAEKAIVSKDELLPLFEEVVRNSDCTMIGSDNLMFEAAPTLVKAALSAKKPVFAADSTSIQAGAVGGYTIDYSQVGTAGAATVARILKGAKAGEIPVVTLQDGFLELNAKAAEQFGLTLGSDLVARAKSVYGRP